MKNNKGITLMSLVIMIIVLLILGSIAASTGASTIRYTKYTNAKYQMEVMHKEVTSLYEKYKDIPSSKKQGFIDSYGADTSTCNATVLEKTFLGADISGEEEQSRYRFFSADYVTDTLGIDGISYDFLVDIANRRVILYNGITYNGYTYYTLEDFDIYNVESRLEPKIEAKEVGTKVEEDIEYTLYQITVTVVNGTSKEYDYVIYVNGEIVQSGKSQEETIVINNYKVASDVGINDAYVEITYSDSAGATIQMTSNHLNINAVETTE